MSNDKLLQDARIALANVLNNMSDNEIAKWFDGMEYVAMADTKSGMRMIRAIALATLENVAAPLLANANVDTVSKTASEPSFGPNQARYEQCAKPHASTEDAHKSLAAYLADVGELRVKHQVPEVIVVAAAYTGEKKETAVLSAGFGDSRTHPELGALAFKIYTAPAIARARKLQQLAQIAPSAEGDDEDG